MIEKIFEIPEKLIWIDVVDPTPEELNQVAQTYNLHESSVQDCLDSEHLPKFERINDVNFTILRAFDEASAHESDTVHELTRKLAIFYGKNFIITIHRKPQVYFSEIKKKWMSANQKRKSNPMPDIKYDLIEGVLLTYEKPLEEAQNHLEKLEIDVFEAPGSKPFELKEGYYLKRRAYVFKRMVRTLSDQLSKITAANSVELTATGLQNLKELADKLYFYADELLENVTSLLSLHISLASQKTNEASHRTNEVMRVLTIFSVFVLPLNLITGIYGMNFESMPELHWKWGYPIVLVLMIFVSVLILFWFSKKGWLKKLNP